MEWLEIIIQHLPTILLVTVAFFFLGAELIKAGRVWKDKRKEAIQSAIDAQQKEAKNEQELKEIHKKLDEMMTQFNSMSTKIQESDQKIALLIESDMNDIKAWIVEQYHKFYIQQGWIDAFSMETIEKRYTDYCRENGNSFVKDLMESLRSLSMDPKEKNKK